MIVEKKTKVIIALEELYEIEKLKYVLKDFQTRSEAKLARSVKLEEDEDRAAGFAVDLLGELE